MKSYISLLFFATTFSTMSAQVLSSAQIEQLKSQYQAGQVQVTNTEQTVDYSRTNNGERVPQTSNAQNIQNLQTYNLYQLQDTTKYGKRQIFGHDIFRNHNLSFEPNMNIAVPQNYLLGPGDELVIDVYGDSQSTSKFQIAPDGSVTIPRVGPINVSGLSVESAQARISAILGQHYDNSTIKLTVAQTRTITIHVMGEVATPGTYTLSAFATVFHALYMAGGISNIGTLRDIQVARGGKIITSVDVYEYILNGRLAGNVMLRDGDVVIVSPYVNLVNITGNVRRPMWYELKPSETLASLIRYSGNFTGTAYTKSVTVSRKQGDKLSVHTVDESGYSAFLLTDQDSVNVDGNEKRYRNLTVISGAVKRPGNYELDKVKTIRGLISAAGGLEEDAQTTRAVLTRTNTDRTLRTISVNVGSIMKGASPDIYLENEDQLTIASMSQINTDKYLLIEGEVFNPDTIPYADNTTIEDLITMAGGLLQSASLLNVEVSRRIYDPMADHEAEFRNETFTFTLSDGLLIGEGTNFVLQPYDKVFIRRSPVYNDQQQVNISGEVMFAGNYVLGNQETRISEIIKRAGGFKDKASVVNARLLRRMSADEIARRDQKIAMSQNSADSIDVTKTELSNQYSVGINLAKAIENPGSDFDIVLRDGDQIIVPQYNATVKISGEVLYPNTVTYVKGKSKDYYISAAGGYTKESIKRRAYIIYANGEVTKLSKGKIEPGCEIVVPQKVHRDNSANAMRWVSISSSIVATLAVIANLIRK